MNRLQKNLNKFIKWLQDVTTFGRPLSFELTEDVSFMINSKTHFSFRHFTDIDPVTREEMRVFLDLTKNSTCLLDIGALHGVFALAFTANHPDREAYAFDPSVKAFKYLREHVRLNPSHNVKAYQQVVSDSIKDVTMKYELDHLVAIGESERVRIRKRKRIDHATTIDDFVKEHNIKPDVIKIDTEGFEYHVIKGGQNYLLQNSPHLHLEIHPPKLLLHGLSPRKLQDLLGGLGYRIYDLRGNLITAPDSYFQSDVAAYRMMASKSPFQV